jgi:4-hydroxybenzoate polyprenyltransferase
VGRWFKRIITAIQLTRLTIAFGAVSDLWFVILLTRASDDYVMVAVHRMTLLPALVAGVVVAVGLFAYGAALNDVLDVRHDTAFSPDRPIPAGRIKQSQAVVVAVGSLIVAVLGAAVLGGDGTGTWAVCITLVTAAGLLFYNATGKYIPSVGVLTIGLVHAAHMFIPNHELSFTLPVWLVMTHAVVIALLVHVLEDKRPRMTRRAIVGVALGWVFWSVVLLGAGALSAGSLWPETVSVARLVYPLLAVIGFVAVAWWKAGAIQGRAAAEKIKRYGAMWQSLYGAAWLLALGMNVEAVWIGLFALAGFTAMTVIKELTGLTGRPIAFRA